MERRFVPLTPGGEAGRGESGSAALEQPRSVRRGGEGRAPGLWAGNVPDPVAAVPEEFFGSYETKYHRPQRGQEVEVEFKNQPGQLQRVSKVRTGGKRWKVGGVF